MKASPVARKNTDAAPAAVSPRVLVTNRVLEQLRLIRRRGTPEEAIEAAELEKLVSARLVQPLPAAA